MEELHPEQDVYFWRYDTRGNFHRKRYGGGPAIRFKRDGSERIEEVRAPTARVGSGDPDSNDYGEAIKEYSYYSSGTGAKGQLLQASRINPDGNGQQQVTEEYQYDAQGRPTSRKTIFEDWKNQEPGLWATFELDLEVSYDSLGNVSTLSYPCRVSGVNGTACDQATRTMSYSYDRGQLSQIESGGQSVFSNISYWPSGMFKEGSDQLGSQSVSMKWDLDTNDLIPRPRLLTFNNQSPSLYTYLYDGAGNIRQRGDNFMEYDGASRLLRVYKPVFDATNGVPGPGQATSELCYRYDGFGNRVKITPFQTGASTERCAAMASTPGTSFNASNQRYVPNHTGYDPDSGAMFWEDFGSGSHMWYQWDELNSLRHSALQPSSAPPSNIDDDDLEPVIQSSSYVYTADGERFLTVVNEPGFTRFLLAVRGLNNEVLREFELEGFPNPNSSQAAAEGSSISGALGFDSGGGPSDECRMTPFGSSCGLVIDSPSPPDPVSCRFDDSGLECSGPLQVVTAPVSGCRWTPVGFACAADAKPGSPPGSSRSSGEEPHFLTFTHFKRDLIYREGTLIGEYEAIEAPSGPPIGDPNNLLLSALIVDHRGDVIVQTHPGFASVKRQNFLYPYGLRVGAGALDCADGVFEIDSVQRYAGHERDRGFCGNVLDDMDYMHARYYQPGHGRFLSVDPINSFDPKVVASWNRYSYALGNPVGNVDPDGREVKLSAEELAAIQSGLAEMGEGALAETLSREKGKAKIADGALGAWEAAAEGNAAVAAVYDVIRHKSTVSFNLLSGRGRLTEGNGGKTDVSCNRGKCVGSINLAPDSMPQFLFVGNSLDEGLPLRMDPAASIFHEFGHAAFHMRKRNSSSGASGINGRPSNDASLKAENAYRSRLGLPLRKRHKPD